MGLKSFTGRQRRHETKSNRTKSVSCIPIKSGRSLLPDILRRFCLVGFCVDWVLGASREVCRVRRSRSQRRYPFRDRSPPINTTSNQRAPSRNARKDQGIADLHIHKHITTSCYPIGQATIQPKATIGRRLL
ncbi:hypothetical protein TNCV_4543741 [Trichonephila clavipes]|nr:hypothetical protein TNCV_4543741 [Trichonephila clavipes]